MPYNIDITTTALERLAMGLKSDWSKRYFHDLSVRSQIVHTT